MFKVENMGRAATLTAVIALSMGAAVAQADDAGKTYDEGTAGFEAATAAAGDAVTAVPVGGTSGSAETGTAAPTVDGDGNAPPSADSDDTAATSTDSAGFGGSFGSGTAEGGFTPPTTDVDVVTEASPVVDDGFGGSFAGEAFDGAIAPPSPAMDGSGAAEPPPASGDAFGGSFGGGAIEPPATTENADGAAVAPGGDAPDIVAPPPPPPPVPSQPEPGIRIDPQVLAFELRDYGVPPVTQLRQGQVSAPTPTILPGGNVATTEMLANALNDGIPLLLIDVMGAAYSIPSAEVAPPMGWPGTFHDRTQQQTVAFLMQETGGKLTFPIVVYCSDPSCWLSYNAALRAIAAGFTDVYWYRGGIQAWQMSGLPLWPSGY